MTGRWDPDPVESLILAMASMVRPGDTWGVGMGTRLPVLALSLARAAGDVDFRVFLPEKGAYAVRLHGAPAGGLTDGALVRVPVSLVFNEDLNRRYGEYFRPAQVDPDGNLNISRVGGRLLVGYTGIAEAMRRYDRAFLFTPRHDTRFFVERVESVTANVRDTGPGIDPDRPCTVLTNLGVFDLDTGRRCLRVRYLYPTATLDAVRAATGFPVDGEGEPPAQPPDPHRLELLRATVDPENRRARP